MTSTEDRLMVPISSITGLADRFRPVYAEVEDLAQSLVSFGQLTPIILDRNGNKLIAGLNRLTAAQLNGWTHIWATYRDDIDEVLAKELELEENVRRKDMTPEQEVKAIAEIHRLKVAKHPESWTQEATAQLIGSARRPDVADAIKLTRMMELFPEIPWAKAGSIRQMKSWAEAKAGTVGRVMDVKAKKVDFQEVEAKVLLGDSVDLIKTFQSETISAIVTDPPFGLDYDKRKDGTSGSLTSYEDSAVSYERLLTMAPELWRVLRPNGWLVWFLGPSWYARCKEVFREAGFTVDEIPLVWDRSEGRSHTNRPDRYFARAYDIALHCIKGNPQMVVRGRANIFRFKPVDTSERETLVERPVELYSELIRCLTVPGELVADFFVGSGSCLAAAANTNRDYIGCELSPERRAVAIAKIKAHTPAAK